MEVKFTKTERAIFVYLFKILQNQNDNDFDYENLIKALQCGFSLHYDEVFLGLYDEELSREECLEVLDILEMYRGIIYSYNILRSAGKCSKLSDPIVKFPGFDGNNETKQLAYTQYFIMDLKRYSEINEISEGYYNSHCPMLNKYRNMLQKWNEYKSLPNRYEMNEEQILTLLSIN